jgi:hypothetical protein
VLDIIMKNYYTAGEAISRLKIPRSTFYDRVEAGEITRVSVPLRKQYVYPKEEIDRIADEKARILGELEAHLERLKFVLPDYDDLVQLVDIDRMIFQEETLILPEQQQKRFAYNPETMHVLKDTRTNTVLGGITMSPLKPDILQGLINLEIDETQVKPEDFLPFTPDIQDCYIIGVVARPGVTEKYYAGKLLYAALGYFIELLDRGIIIRRLYTVATTKDGDELAQRLRFTLLASKQTIEHEDFRKSYVLDLESTTTYSKLVKRYVRARKNLERRRKRYKKD